MIDTTELRRLAEAAQDKGYPLFSIPVPPATVLELLDERAKLLEVLKMARYQHKMNPDGTRMALFDAIHACSDIKTEAEK